MDKAAVLRAHILEHLDPAQRAFVERALRPKTAVWGTGYYRLPNVYPRYAGAPCLILADGTQHRP